MALDNTKLSFDEFSKPTYDDWKTIATESLNGISFEKALFTKTFEDIELQPLYNKENIKSIKTTGSLPGIYPYLRGISLLSRKDEPWLILQQIAEHDPIKFNETAKNYIKNGLNVFNITFLNPTLNDDKKNSNGTFFYSLKDLENAFSNLDITKFPIYFSNVAFPVVEFCFIAAYCKNSSINAGKIHGGLNFDPLANMLSKPECSSSLDIVFDRIKDLISWTKNNLPHFKIVGVSGIPYHEGGASAIQELGFAVSTGVEYVRELLKRGIDINEIAKSIVFSFSIGSNFFIEIAKLRAARILWAKIIKLFGGNDDSQKIQIHACTSSLNKSKLDAHTNILRATIETMAAIIGGADGINVGTFDAPIGLQDDFSQRIARNTQLVLKYEAHLDEVTDSAGGSWFVESLTESVARHSWELFREVEKQGGIIKSLMQEYPQKQIAIVADRRLKRISIREDTLLGVNKYPNINEKANETRTIDSNIPKKIIQNWDKQKHDSNLNKINEYLNNLYKTNKQASTIIDDTIEAIIAGANIEEVTKAVCIECKANDKFKYMPKFRAAAIFEELRGKAVFIKTDKGDLPKALLLNFGTIKQWKARNDFSADVLHVGGFETVNSPEFNNVGDALQFVVESDFPIVVICSSDIKYPDFVEELSVLIKNLKPNIKLILSGYPKDYIEKFKLAGVDDFVYMKSDIYKFLSNLYS